MVDVLLTHSNHLHNDRKQVRKMQPYPPLQTMLAAACLRQAGYSVALFDPTLESPEAGFGRALARYRPRLVAVCEDNFNYLTKMCLLRNRELAHWMAGQANLAGVPAIVNGSDASDRVAEYLQAGFEYVLVGEVEEAIVEVARQMLDGTDAGSGFIRGAAFLEGRADGSLVGQAIRLSASEARLVTLGATAARTGESPVPPLPVKAGFQMETPKVRYPPRRAPIADLDALPAPAWDLIDPEPYRQAWTSAHGYYSINMVSSRGCPYGCNWCAKPIWGDTYHCRSARLVAAEMLAVKTRFRPDHLWFADDIFVFSREWPREFASVGEPIGAQTRLKMKS